MEFFNRKEDVIEFTLTPHGKKLFRNGNFKPTYYAFTDTSLLYDSRYAGYSGSQNEISDRIESTPTLKKSVYFTNDLKEYQTEFIHTTLLGSSELGQQKFPAFEIKLHSGHITGSIQYLTSTISNSRIPKFEVHMNNVYNTGTNEFSFQENLLIEVNEINGIFEKENFEFELYELQQVTIPGMRFLGGYVGSDATIEIPIELEFTPIEKLSLAISDNVDSLFSDEPDIYPSQVEYWFDILKDEQISEEIMFKTSLKESIYLKPQNNQTGTQC